MYNTQCTIVHKFLFVSIKHSTVFECTQMLTVMPMGVVKRSNQNRVQRSQHEVACTGVCRSSDFAFLYFIEMHQQ